VISLAIPEFPPSRIHNDELMMVEEELSKIEPNNTKSFDSQEEVFQEEEEKVSYNPVTQPTIENR